MAVSTTVNVTTLFLEADVVVQVIMAFLLMGSIFCWAIIFNKIYMIKSMRREMDIFENLFWSGISLDEIFRSPNARPSNPMSKMFISAMNEWRQTTKRDQNLVNSIERVMGVVHQKEEDKMDNNMSVLASIGSASPFIGLLGTVWGIMNSFTAIAATKQTSIAVVAPGIAEALFATALGLFAAIPATIAYNKLSSDMDRLHVRLESFTGEFVGIISRNTGD